MKKPSKKIIAILVSLGFVLTQFSMSLYLPAMPTLAKVFHSTDSKIMFTLAILMSGYAIGQLIWGTLSDFIGHKKALSISTLSYFIVATMMCFSQSILSFSILIFFLGFMAASFTSVGNAVIKDTFDKNIAGKIIAYIEISMAFAPVIAPIIGVHLLIWISWKAIYGFLSLYSLSLLILNLIFQDSLQKKKITTPTTCKTSHAYRSILSHKLFLAYILVLGLMFGTFFSYMDAAPFLFVKHLKMSLQSYGWLFLGCSLTYAIGAILVSLLIDKIGTLKLVSIGVGLNVAGNLLFLMANLQGITVINISIAFFISMLGFGLALPACKSGAMIIFNQHHGAVASIMKFTQTTLGFVLICMTAYMEKLKSMMPLSILYILVAVVIFMLFYSLKSDGNSILTFKTKEV